MKYGVFKCANCGDEYEKISSHHKTCCKKCSSSLWYKEHKKESLMVSAGTCLNCGETFERKRNSLRHKYCTNRCRLEHIKKENVSKGATCKECGSIFVLGKVGTAQKYCSVKCRKSYSRKKCAAYSSRRTVKKKIDVKCPGCQKTYQAFIDYIGTGTPRFFCLDCKKRNNYIESYIPDGRRAEILVRL
jgi:DNA-directed RNA polymerase subunit RPC12/RpoP